MESTDYFILTRINTLEGTTWKDWMTGKGETEEIILGVFLTPEGAHEGIQAEIRANDSIGYAIQSFCNCCGKFASSATIWFDPIQKQMFGANG